jgi:ribokinase
MKIVVVGSSNTDMIIQVPHVPKPGETILGGRFSIAPGGKGANQAVAAARAGGEVTFIAKVGDDMFGDQAVAGFERDGIHVHLVGKDAEAPSGVALIFVGDDGENSIGVASGANMNLSPADVRAASETITSADILVMQLESPLDTVTGAARIASDAGVPVMLNPAPAQPLPDALLSCVTLLTPNESEIELLTGIRVLDQKSAIKAGNQLLNKGVANVLVTMGSNGVCLVNNKSSTIIPAFEVKPIDTTAAGDTFNGALATALAKDLALEEAVGFANAAAALSVTRMGAQPSIPSRKEIEKMLSSSGT